MQLNRVSALPTRNLEVARSPMTIQLKCGDQETLSRQKVASEYANPAIVHGRKRTRTTTCIDSLSLFVLSYEKGGIPTALSSKVCATIEPPYEASSQTKERILP